MLQVKHLSGASFTVSEVVSLRRISNGIPTHSGSKVGWSFKRLRVNNLICAHKQTISCPFTETTWYQFFFNNKYFQELWIQVAVNTLKSNLQPNLVVYFLKILY